MILINTLGIQDSGGITVLKKALEECLLDKSNKYLIACSDNENIRNLCNIYKDTSHYTFKIFKTKNLLRRLYIENIIFRILQKKHNIKLIYNFSGSAQFFSKTPQLIKLHDLSFYSRDVDKEFLVQKKYLDWLITFIKRLVRSSMIKQCEFIEMQSRHVQSHIEDYINISNKRLFFKSDIDIKQADFHKPILIDPNIKLTLIYIVGPHFEVAHKNFSTFVKAALKLKDEGFNFEIAVTLTKEELHRSSLWNSSLDTRTRFIGYLPKNRLMGIFKGNSILISTSIIETLGLHVIEAVQHGVPVIVPNKKYSFSVYGSSVLTYETLNPNSLTKVIKKASTNTRQELNAITLDSQQFLLNDRDSKLSSILDIISIIFNEKIMKNMKKTTIICSNCVMDTSDTKIRFDENGKCDHCINFEKNIAPNWHTGKSGQVELEKMANKIKLQRTNKDFNCIIGLSGGLDSSYTAYIAKEVMGLKPLLLHVDAGWNTDQAVGNIEKLVDGLGLDLYTEVINWKEMQDLQVAFFKSQIADQDIPQDTAFFSALYRFARKNKI